MLSYIIEKEEQLKKIIENMGSTKVANITGLKKQYLSNFLHGHINLSLNKIIDILEMIK